MFNSPMLISKAQLLNNQHVEPLYDEKTDSSPLKYSSAQRMRQNKKKRQRDPVVVDSSVRECNEWSIYTVSLPTRLHVKCNCFSSNVGTHSSKQSD
ncbi:hypothetical protein GCK32_011239 [Trichostrongylus colubriformis]|uniref:Uncharacterized protein n=1 Tax=Trichostrongylus colubriformis TaxID=6319 RepID=A0AAN8FGX4_TRICO